LLLLFKDAVKKLRSLIVKQRGKNPSLSLLNFFTFEIYIPSVIGVLSNSIQVITISEWVEKRSDRRSKIQGLMFLGSLPPLPLIMEKRWRLPASSRDRRNQRSDLKIEFLLERIKKLLC
jgi:hypothetical protein